MSQRLINNLIAAGIVTTFWIALVFPLMVQAADPIVSDSTVTSTGTQTTTVKSPPPSAIAPQAGGSNSDLCTISSSGALGTQILSLSFGATYTEANCLLLKKARMLYSAGMKVASVSLLCQDPDIWRAMMDAGSPCPIDGLIGEEARLEWEVRTMEIPMPTEENEITAQQSRQKALSIMGAVASAFILF